MTDAGSSDTSRLPSTILVRFTRQIKDAVAYEIAVSSVTLPAQMEFKSHGLKYCRPVNEACCRHLLELRPQKAAKKVYFKMRPTQLASNLLCCLAIASCVSCGPAGDPEQTSSTNVQEEPTVTDSTVETTGTPAVTDPKEATTQEPAAAQEDHSGQVLRHAVFFSFKETATENDIKAVISAFAELPSKIDSIIDFQWGTSNSPEEHDDGFTHCFFLTFKDEAGRAKYLPHPDHKAFGDVLRPHNDKVFVIDYWGTPQEKMENELKHAVFFKFKDDASPEAVKEVEDAFAALPSKIDTIKAFEWGKNNSPERHSHGFTHCFMVTFADDAGREAYLPHDAHKAFVDVLKPSLDKVRVLDFTPGE